MLNVAKYLMSFTKNAVFTYILHIIRKVPNMYNGVIELLLCFSLESSKGLCIVISQIPVHSKLG